MIGFAAPFVLGALVALPAIWWLLRLTPPRPRRQPFPPTRLLAELPRDRETPARSPWWLTALRLLLGAVLIFAVAGPILSPLREEAPGNGPLLLVVENGWAAGDRWDEIRATADAILALADEADRPVALVATAEPPGAIEGPARAADVRLRLDALEPRPFAADHATLLPAIRGLAQNVAFGGVVWLTDGVGAPDIPDFAAGLDAAIDAPILVYARPSPDLVALLPPQNRPDALVAPIIASDPGRAAGIVLARDIDGRVIAEAPFAFDAGATTTTAEFVLPTELRNDIASLAVAAETSAGAMQLLDERHRRRSVGIVTGGPTDAAQPLLSPDYYLTRALTPFADVRTLPTAGLDDAIATLVESGVPILILADVGTLPAETEARLANWVGAGGTLIRFAGPRLAAAETAPTLVPVALRIGGRTLGGTLSWETPQPLGEFPADAPFAGLDVPGDVRVSRQVLAEPSAATPDNVWATLADGTPLVTGARRGDGLLVLFHVTADTGWSDLPLSGTFVEMLRRIIAMAAVPESISEPGAAPVALQPYRVLDGFGRLTSPGPSVAPITGADAPVGRDTPPGLYGPEEGRVALNLLGDDATLPAFDPGPLADDLRPYPDAAPTELRPYLLGAALILFLIDIAASLVLAGTLRLRGAGTTAATLVVGALALAAILGPAPPAVAQTLTDSEAAAVAAAGTTPLAYVVTGVAASDAISRAGLTGLSIVLRQRTAYEPPTPPTGVDPAADELAFYPLLYWRVDANAPLPSAAALANIDTYLRNGGVILFDTADELARPLDGGASPAGRRLQDILATVNLPPLEPVPPDHVLTKTFYLLDDFPGRYVGGELWVEALPPAVEGEPPRPARAGDGVSPVLITSNDLASAWAVDDSRAFLYPVVGGDDRQREFAFRVGVNIVMYVLTGNYKTDQVHVPALLERLGR